MTSNNQIRKNPKHKTPKPTNQAKAPYNFVPLPEKVIYLDPASLLDFDKYDGLTGHIECSLRVLTPLYTRTAITPDFYKQWGEKIRDMMAQEEARKEYAQFFHIDNAEIPLIPGSTLRGMIRSLVEIISYSKIQWVTNNQLFFRTMDNSAIGKYYRGRMSENIESGFLRYANGKYFIQQCQSVKIPRKLLGSLARLYDGQAPNKTPSWDGYPSQYEKVWVQLSANKMTVQSLSNEKKPNYVPGILVITGDMVNKKHEFVFLEPAEDSESIPVSDEIIQRFQDPDQLSQWQEKAFPEDKPTNGNRKQNGALRHVELLSKEGDPVFFLREENELVFFGRAKMFRLPYKKSPLDLVPYHLRSLTTNQGKDTVDVAEAIFGYINEGGRDSSRAGSVRFTDAILDEGQSNVLFDSEITPDIMGSPKPTAFQQYLVQSAKHDPDQKNRLAHYDTENDETVIRGTKLYWHKQKMDETVEVNNWADDKQHTQLRPVKPGTKFTFRIHFENLHPELLGALLWAVDLPTNSQGKKYRHKLGMGKPRGLGSVRISSKLYLSNRQNSVTETGEFSPGRYGMLLDADGWFTPERRIKKEIFIEKYEAYVLAEMDQIERQNANTLSDVPRIAAMLKLLDRAMSVQSQNSRYMAVQPNNEYYHRPVLPNAVDVS